MIPVCLQLRNFMCYRENVPPLDFNGIHLACLSGNNGNGKSAIIDAITWALWGKARAGSIDDLIYATATEMEVQFDFTSSGDLYRVIRKRSRPKKRTGAGQSSLEFQIRSGESFRAVSGNTIDETQKKIIDTIHMDYDTFINSAYLRQGHADEFTRQPPGKRKEVLGTILGLETYDTLEEKAKLKARHLENECLRIEAAVKDMAAELEHRAEYETEFEQAQATLSEADGSVREKEKSLRDLRRQLETLEQQKSQLDTLERQIESNRKLSVSLEQQAGEHHAAILRYQAMIDRKIEIETGYSDLQSAKKTSEDLTEKFRQSVALERRKSDLEKHIDQAKNELLKKQALYQQRIEELETRVKVLPELREKLTLASREMSGIDEQETALKEKETSIRELQQVAGSLQAEKTRLEREIAEAGEKLDLLARHRESHTDARCPLCESELTQEGLDLIESKYKKERAEKTDLLKKALTDIEQQNVTLQQMKNECTVRETTLKEQQNRLHNRIGSLRKDIEEREGEEVNLRKGREYIAAVMLQLERQEYAAAEQKELAVAVQQMAALGYDEERHRIAQEQVTKYQSWEEEYRKLEEAVRLIGQEQTGFTRAEESAAGLRESMQQDEERQITLAASLEALPALQEQVKQAEAEYKELADRRSLAQEAVGGLRAKLERLTELSARRKERENNLAETAKKVTVYKELSRAFGKSGIQAFLIDMAIPEIESKANDLLTRMTDNRMHVNFETQQETRSGTVKETLDIFITDELGTRDYEMFSGGEAFRINFAIRIALSKLLAQRAGAPMPTLIIDEGFGTQDSTGMEKLKEAINSIQNDFQKILVITHMDDLKDAFPTRIDVVKTADGSSIAVN